MDFTKFTDADLISFIDNVNIGAGSFDKAACVFNKYRPSDDQISAVFLHHVVVHNGCLIGFAKQEAYRRWKTLVGTPNELYTPFMTKHYRELNQEQRFKMEYVNNTPPEIDDNWADTRNRTMGEYFFKNINYACPEQYEVFQNGYTVGYVKLRGGYFMVTVRAPLSDTAVLIVDGDLPQYQHGYRGEEVLDLEMSHQLGAFETALERKIYLTKAVEAIQHYQKTGLPYAI